MIGRMNAKQLANGLRSQAWVEADPDRRALFEQAAAALENKRKRGRKPNSSLQRQADIVLVERYHEIKKEFEQKGLNNPATQAFEGLAKERGLKGGGETARRIYLRARKRSRLG
jgi:Asp-tRNA(Asn)/Glu-tRNA(Gln) amidotransferase A subunit family amidase